MRTSLIALGLLALGLSQCSGDRGLFVGADREDAGAAGEPENGGTGGDASGGSGGGSQGGSGNGGGTENTGGSGNRGGTGSGAEGGEPSETGGSGGGTAARGGGDTGGGDTGGSDTGGTDAGGSGGSGTAARGGMNDGGRAGSANAGAGGVSDGGRAGSANAGSGGGSTNDCEALAREYRERLAAAQQCSPLLTVEQCTIEMPDDFFCPCKTFVNPIREADVRRLNEILEKRMSCARTCPAIACPDVRRGVCANATTTAEPIVGAPGRCIASI